MHLEVVGEWETRAGKDDSASFACDGAEQARSPVHPLLGPYVSSCQLVLQQISSLLFAVLQSYERSHQSSPRRTVALAAPSE